MTGTTSLEFTEEMKGFVTLDETDTQRGYDQGRKDGTGLMFHLKIRTEDVDTFVAQPEHEAAATGYVDSDVFGGRRPVEQGVSTCSSATGRTTGRCSTGCSSPTRSGTR